MGPEKKPACCLCKPELNQAHLCERHLAQAKDRSARYNLSLSDAIDQMYWVALEHLKDEAADKLYAEESQQCYVEPLASGLESRGFAVYGPVGLIDRVLRLLGGAR